MSLSILRLREYISGQRLPDPETSFVALEEGSHPALYVYGKSMALSMIKHPDLKPINFMDFWKLFTGASEKDFPDIEDYFRKTPLILHGEPHFEARRSLLPLYRRLELALTSWVDEFTLNFFKSHSSDKAISALDFVEAYLSEVFKKLMGDELGLKSDQFPSLPGKIFQLLTELDLILDYQAKVHVLRGFIETALSSRDEKDRQELWGLISIVVMGTDTLSGALYYWLSSTDKIESAEALFNQSRPLSLVSREATIDISIDTLKLNKGQRVYISTGLYEKNKTEAAIPFGVGVHLCPGKKISFILMESFIQHWKKFPQLHPQIGKIKLLRDTVLKAKEM